MPRDGSGNFVLGAGNPVVTNTVISSSGWANPTMSDLASGLTQSLSRDGQTTPTANLTMGNFRLMALANATLRTDAITAGQVQDNAMVVLSSIGGTGDAITAATAPAFTVYAANSKFVYTPTASNTLTNPTIAIDGLTAKTIVQSNGLGLWSGALVIGTPYELLYDGTNFRIQSGQLGNTIPISQSQLGFRNRIIDGNFDLWDVNTSFGIAANVVSYTSNMFTATPGVTGGACTVSRSVWAPGGEAAGMTTPSINVLRFAQTSPSSSGNPNVTTNIESSATLEGRSATFSCWLWATSGTPTVPQVFIAQIFGSGGSASIVNTQNVNWNLTSTPQRFSVRFDLASIAGKTIGTGDHLNIGISFPLSTTFIVQTTQWQLEDCPAGAPTVGLPTPFEFRGLATETNMARRFYQQMGGTARFPAALAGQVMDTPITLVPPMRIAPAASLFTAGARVNIAAATAITLTTTGSRFEIQATAAGDCYALQDLWQFDARY